MIAVVAGVLCRDDKLMLCCRPEGKRLAGFFEFPGGKLEAGESPEDALRRELREELNIQDLRVGCILDAICSQEGDILLLFYACSADEDPEALEHSEIRFVRAEEADQMPLAPMDRKFLDRYMRKGDAACAGTDTDRG